MPPALSEYCATAKYPVFVPEPTIIRTPAYAASHAGASLAPFVIQRREPGPHDLLIEVSHCGVCHSDIHQVREEWGTAIFPMVPGHEVVGTVSRVGDSVRSWRPGDRAGVSVLVDSCRRCKACAAGEEQYCENLVSYTYNGLEQDGNTPTYGGYSARITIDERYALRIPEEIPPERAAPLLCAGITTYSPLRHFGVKEGDKVAVVGLGGLGHLGVKFARAMGAEVTIVSHSPGKKQDAGRLGASGFISTEDPSWSMENARRFDYVLDTVSASHDYNSYLSLLRTDGTMVLVGLPGPSMLRAQSLVDRRLRLAGSSAGGIREAQQMLEYAATQKVAADVETIPIQDVNKAFERTVRGDVRYRFVIDMSSLGDSPSGPV